MSKANINPYDKKVAVSVALRHKLTAESLHMSLTTFIDWLEEKASFSSVYNDLARQGRQEAEGNAAQQDNAEQSNANQNNVGSDATDAQADNGNAGQ